jgi:hypothetical protein
MTGGEGKVAPILWRVIRTQRLLSKEWGHENFAELEGLVIIMCVTSLNALF